MRGGVCYVLGWGAAGGSCLGVQNAGGVSDNRRGGGEGRASRACLGKRVNFWRVDAFGSQLCCLFSVFVVSR